MCRSVPQMEATWTLTRTSVRPYVGILTSRISAPGAASGLTTASMVLGIGSAGHGSPLVSTELEEQTTHSTPSKLHFRFPGDCSNGHGFEIAATFCMFREYAFSGSQFCNLRIYPAECLTSAIVQSAGVWRGRRFVQCVARSGRARG